MIEGTSPDFGSEQALSVSGGVTCIAILQQGNIYSFINKAKEKKITFAFFILKTRLVGQKFIDFSFL